MKTAISFGIDYDEAVKQAKAALGSLPQAMERARKRALRKLMTWLQRQVLREAAAAADVTQRSLRAALRYRASLVDDGIDIWIGTNPIAAHHLGTVRWTRRMKGARVGRRSFAGTWSWGPGSRTGSAVMRRTGQERMPIERVDVEIHDAIERRVLGMGQEISERFERLVIQEMNYALLVEGAK